MKRRVQLDLTKLLGFRALNSAGALGAKAGAKPGAKVGVKLGLKAGIKAG